MSKCKNFICFCTGKCRGSDDSNVVWTGPSVRIKDGEALLDSYEYNRDIQAAAELIKNTSEKPKIDNH